MSAADDGQMEDLQVRLTFLDDAVSGLLNGDAELSRRLATVERKLDAIHAELLSLRVAGDHDPDSEPPPPHY